MGKNGKLLAFVADFTRLIESGADEAGILDRGRDLLAALVAADDWLADEYAQADPEFYRQYLLYADPLDRLSVVSFVWGPGQRTPVHDHGVWGLVGVLRGSEIASTYARDARGKLVEGASLRLEPGSVVAVSPTIGDIHRVANALGDRVSVSIHVYGGNIGRIRRSAFDVVAGTAKDFVSGYSNDRIPNLWASSPATSKKIIRPIPAAPDGTERRRAKD